MATYRPVDINLPEAARLSDLSGIQRDLESSIEMAREYLANAQVGRNQSILYIDALTTAILVRYSRPFASGTRMTAHSFISTTLTDEEQKWHRIFRDWRNKHIAHPENCFEENRVVAYLNPDERGQKVNSVETQNFGVVGLSASDASHLILVAEKIMEAVLKEIESEKIKIAERLNTVPIKEIYTWDSASAPIVGTDDIRKPRAKP